MLIILVPLNPPLEAPDVIHLLGAKDPSPDDEEYQTFAGAKRPLVAIHTYSA
jgi:hypothetical protein